LISHPIFLQEVLQLRTAALPLNWYECWRHYVRANIVNLRGLPMLSSILMLAAAVIGVSLGARRYGDLIFFLLRECATTPKHIYHSFDNPGEYLLGIKFILDPTQKAVSTAPIPSKFSSSHLQTLYF